MRKVIISFNEVIELNHILEDKGLRFKVHLHDACGAQSFTVESLEDGSAEGNVDEVKTEITSYFENKRIQIKFSQINLDFIVAS